MNISSKLVGAGLALFGAMSLSAAVDTASAASITQAGELVGYTWAPLPEGLYFATTGSYGNFRNTGVNKSELGVNIPVIVWSTPWKIFGARVEAYVAQPSIALGIPAGPGPATYISALYNPYGNVGLAWDLGHGFGLSTFVGGYVPINNALGQDFWTFNSRTGLTWSGDGWAITGHVVYGVTGTNLASGAGVVGSTFGAKISPNYVNLDLSAIKSFGKFSVGPVAFGSWDVSGISGPVPYAKQSQFAVGAFVGYDFGPVILQTYVTHDVASQNYVGGAGTPFAHEVYETRGWLRVIVPLWTAPTAPAPVVAKY